MLKGNNAKCFELINNLILQFESLPFGNDAALDILRRRSFMILEIIFGESSKYLKDAKSISFHSPIHPCTEDSKNYLWKIGKQKMINLLTIVKEDLTLSNELKSSKHSHCSNENKEYSNKVFVVHGHDEACKERLAHFLREFGLDPIVLHDQPNKGRTIIEKFEEEASDVGYAFVLMTPDDVGMEKGLFEQVLKGIGKEGLCYRARQNVVMELGFFYGKLGRNRVCCLMKGDVEKPSDFSGIVYLSFINKVDELYRDIIKELRASGYEIKL